MYTYTYFSIYLSNFHFFYLEICLSVHVLIFLKKFKLSNKDAFRFLKGEHTEDPGAKGIPQLKFYENV